MTQNGITASILSRRSLLAGAGALLLMPYAALAEPRLQLDGLFSEPWLSKPSGALGAGFAEAAKSGKNFAILWEMRGCPWCKRLHIDNFARKDIADYLQANFMVIQLNLRGKGKLADFDGEELTEEDLSYKSGINSTPTFQFFKAADAAKEAELGRTGYLEPDDFLSLLHFIREKGYEKGTYDEWIVRHKSPA
jgi:thioredoxin-related protein